MEKRAIANIRTTKPDLTRGSRGLIEIDKVRVFNTEVDSIADLLKWCEDNKAESVGITFETEKPISIEIHGTLEETEDDPGIAVLPEREKD